MEGLESMSSKEQMITLGFHSLEESEGCPVLSAAS